MNHGHHHHHHSHHHGRAAKADYGRAFAIGVILNSFFVVFEGTWGFFGNSLALIADAGHNLGDVLGLLLAWGASMLSKRSPSKRRTYGLRRSSILATLLNAIILLISVGAIAYEAFHRLFEPAHSQGWTIIWVSSVGIVINGATALLFASGRKADINIRGAFLHMLADAAISAVVLFAGIALLFTDWFWLDPVLSILISALIAKGTWALLMESMDLAMDAVPRGIEPEEVKIYLKSLPGVAAVHDLHIWGMSTTEAALTAHLVRKTPESDHEILTRAVAELESRFHIHHVTIQLETEELARECGLLSDDVV